MQAELILLFFFDRGANQIYINPIQKGIIKKYRVAVIYHHEYSQLSV